MSAGEVAVRGLRAGYGDTTILDLDELDVRPGEFLSVLGPSGCGKTTLLNVIAGFIEPAAGSVLIDGVDVTAVPSHRRNLGLVFQNYALFPHMSVAQNVAYGLRIRKRGGGEQSSRVAEVLDLVGLADYADRRPRQLSGGQQQRIALARALAYEPSVLLLDEPLSNLDAKLRRHMQSELRQIQQRVGTTMIFVTHDQEEALTLSDRIALLSGGRVEQLGTPQEVYRTPRTPFVADFLGAGNLLPATVLDDRTVVTDAGGRLPVATGRPPGAEVVVVLRRERVRVRPDAPDAAGPRGVVTFRAFSGSAWQVHVRLVGDADAPDQHPIEHSDRDARVIGLELPDTGVMPPAEGTPVRLEWDDGAAVVIDR